MRTEIYSDIKTFLDGVGKVEGVQAVLQQLYNFLTTEKRERRYRTNAGFNLSDYVFENFDSLSSFQLKTDLFSSIRNQIPMVIPIFSLSEVIEDPDNHKYKLKLVFNIKGLTDNRFEFFGAIFK